MGAFPCSMDIFEYATITADERFVIIFGSASFYDYKIDRFYVLDRNGKEYQMKKCNISLSANYHVVHSHGGSAVRYGLLVSGYIRNLYALAEFEGMAVIPMEIMDLVIKCSALQELIHFVEFDSTKKVKPHFALAIEDIVAAAE